MIRIRRIYSTGLATDSDLLAQVKAIFVKNFTDITSYAEKIPDMLDYPFRYGYRAVLLVARTSMSKVAGFSLVLHFPKVNSSFLDFIAVDPDIKARGIGSALYEATREHLVELHSRGLYFEVLPDDPDLVKDPKILEKNRKTLKFYEHYGVYPIIGTEYATPIDESPAPYLLLDGLGRKEPLSRSECRAAVRTILGLRYGHLVGSDYIERVVESIVDDPVRFRPARYVKTEAVEVPTGKIEKGLVLVTSEEHRIHHVKERGYVERPARVEVLKAELLSFPWFQQVPVRHHSEKMIKQVHDPNFVNYLHAVCETLSNSRPVYPYVFPIRSPNRRPKDLRVRAGYYCIDTFTPLDRNAYRAARAAVDVALTAAAEVLQGRLVAYALCRPPGHHAERRVFGGFCYFNNAAIAADWLSREGKVAVLDIDYHHGNGTQDIFYQRADVLTTSIHGHPNTSYPYFSGFANEVGEGEGRGFNRNFPLQDEAGEAVYLAVLDEALRLIRGFAPKFLVVCLGFDTMKGDPTGSFDLSAGSLGKIGRRIVSLNLPILVVQEGGYSLRNLRSGSVSFFRSLSAVVRER
ncbi:MAG TPA: histone deacetylase family protein [Spirochaetia bacterium]|nr:histone deacetylase family protein [Spirochaetia bacterium]